MARPMYLYDSIEQVGTGTEMIVAKCVEQGLRSPEFEQDTNFVVTFWKNGKKKIVEEKIEKDLSQNQKKILGAIQTNAHVTQ